jgi:hypothetical protein
MLASAFSETDLNPVIAVNCQVIWRIPEELRRELAELNLSPRLREPILYVKYAIYSADEILGIDGIYVVS